MDNKWFEEKDELKKQIRPLVDKWLKEGNKDPDTEINSYACLFCKHSLCFYDDIDPCCVIGFAGQEFLCPILQEEYNVKVDNFKLDKDIIDLIAKDGE